MENLLASIQQLVVKISDRGVIPFVRGAQSSDWGKLRTPVVFDRALWYSCKQVLGVISSFVCVTLQTFWVAESDREIKIHVYNIRQIAPADDRSRTPLRRFSEVFCIVTFSRRVSM